VGGKKRVLKAGEKEERKNGEDEVVPIRDEQGRTIFLQVDFENPIIIHFKTLDGAKDENFKVNWKDIENMVKEQFDRLKVVYSRADKSEGDLAISSHKVDMG
jgi:Holliday junction resolvase RusA-like endonuclease